MGSFHPKVVLFLLFLCFVVYPLAAVQTAEGSFEGSITRGSRFTVSIIGLPNTAYYVWIPHTSTMTGEPHDQPPVIAGSQSDLRQDPPEGPYLIGSYRFSNGGGETIRDDIAPSTPDMSNTRYYGLVTTDSSGRATVEFLTSFNTAIRSYSVRVENPRSAESGNLLVEVHTYSRTVPPTTAISTTQVPTSPPTTPAITTTVITTVPGTTALPQTSLPVQTTTRRASLGAEAGILALAAGCLALRRR